MARARSNSSNNSTANLGFEAKRWQAADKLRSNMDAGEYKHVVLGKDDDVRWQWSEATWTTNGRPKGERNRAHQFVSPKRCNANFASPSLPHSAFRLRTLKCLAPQGMAGFVLANSSMSANQPGEGDIRRAKARLNGINGSLET